MEAVKADALLNNLDDYYFLDCSYGELEAFKSFEDKHIKGAIFLRIDAFRDTDSIYPHMCPTKS